MPDRRSRPMAAASASGGWPSNPGGRWQWVGLITNPVLPARKSRGSVRLFPAADHTGSNGVSGRGCAAVMKLPLPARFSHSNKQRRAQYLRARIVHDEDGQPGIAIHGRAGAGCCLHWQVLMAL